MQKLTNANADDRGKAAGVSQANGALGYMRIGAHAAYDLRFPAEFGNFNTEAGPRGRILGHRLIKAHPDSKGSEFDAGEEVIGRFVVARGYGAVVFDFVEEALDEISVSVKVGAEGRHILAV
jgi:hypothetical protein